MLAGLKSDERTIDKETCEAKTKEFKFIAYVECSAKLLENCDEVFTTAIKHGITYGPPP